jgi:hypothetical protein
MLPGHRLTKHACDRSEPIEQWEENFKPDHEESEIKALTDRCKVGSTVIRSTADLQNHLANHPPPCIAETLL